MLSLAAERFRERVRPRGQRPQTPFMSSSRNGSSGRKAAAPQALKPLRGEHDVAKLRAPNDGEREGYAPRTYPLTLDLIPPR